jgi:allantoate deiminase
MNVSGARIARDLAAVNRFGATAAGGAQRLAWTDEEVAARRWLMEECRTLGLTVEQDEAGNVWAHSGEPRVVFLGSHLDTVPDGGRFDGALGVISALEVLRAALEAGVPEARRLGLVCFTDEEGARFGIGMLGSRSVAGMISAEEIAAAIAADGTRLPDVLERYDIDPVRIPLAAARRAAMAAYVELHIEQGAELERAGLAVGIVTGIVGVSNWRISVEGIANHAGATRPEDRHDALIPVAELALAAQRVMRARPGLVATVGEAGVVGGASNIVPGRARCTLDARSLDDAVLEQAVRKILSAAERAADDNGCTLRPQEVKRMPPAEMAPVVMDAFDDAARAEGIAAARLPSRAAHDGMNIAHAGVPVGMVFVRSQAGVSHAPAEFSIEDDCEAGARVLARGAIELVRRFA